MVMSNEQQNSANIVKRRLAKRTHGFIGITSGFEDTAIRVLFLLPLLENEHNRGSWFSKLWGSKSPWKRIITSEPLAGSLAFVLEFLLADGDRRSSQQCFPDSVS
jgi:hypothetical protein